MSAFDDGYCTEPFRSLCASAPDASAYPADRFRVEWGPVFHRGRLDGTARVLVIGQDPAAHENVTRRVLCGVAGHRVQGFLAKLGIERSYVMINAYLYSLYGTDAPAHTPAQLADRFQWIDAILTSSPVESVVTFGSVAGKVWRGYVDNRHPAHPPRQTAALHPTAHTPEPQLLANWNAALDEAGAAVTHPDRMVPLTHYGSRWNDTADLAPIPSADLPAGLPGWMAGAVTWAVRGDEVPLAPKESRITLTVPEADRPVR